MSAPSRLKVWRCSICGVQIFKATRRARREAKRTRLAAASAPHGSDRRTGADRGLRFSYGITSGNEADLDLADYLNFLVDDPDTHQIALFIEGIRRPQAFMGDRLPAGWRNDAQHRRPPNGSRHASWRIRVPARRRYWA